MGRANGDITHATLERRPAQASVWPPVGVAAIDAVRRYSDRATSASEHEQIRLERGEDLDDVTQLLERSDHPLASQEGMASCHPRFRHSGLTALEPSEWYRIGDHRTALGYIVNEHGDKVGDYSYSTMIDDADELHVHISGAYLYDGQLRNRGFMRAYTTAVEERYKALGADYLTVNACNVGGYAWVGTGFVFDPRVVAYHHDRVVAENAHERVVRQARSIVDSYKLDEALQDGQISHAFYDQVESLIALYDQPISDQTLITPQQIAALGKDGAHWRATDEKGTTSDMWLGKALLLNTMWSGIKPLR